MQHGLWVVVHELVDVLPMQVIDDDGYVLVVYCKQSDCVLVVLDDDVSDCEQEV